MHGVLLFPLLVLGPAPRPQPRKKLGESSATSSEFVNGIREGASVACSAGRQKVWPCSPPFAWKRKERKTALSHLQRIKMDFTFSSLSKSAAEEEAEKKARCDFPREKGDGGKELKTGKKKRAHMGWNSHTLSRPPPFSNTREGESSIERRGCGWVKERGKVVRYERTAGEESERRAASKESFLPPLFSWPVCILEGERGVLSLLLPVSSAVAARPSGPTTRSYLKGGK